MRNKCPICDEESGEVFFSRKFEALQTVMPFKSYTVKRCSNCGMIYAADIDEAMSLEDYYKMMSKYDNLIYGNDSVHDEYYSRIEEVISAYNKKSVSLLDIGSGNGKLLRLLQKRGYNNLMGLEPSQKSCQYIVDNYDIKMINGAIGQDLRELNGKTFECITMTGVIEHILPLKDMLSLSLEYLEDDGKLYIDAPNIEYFHEFPDLYQQFSCEHINYFSYHSLENLLNIFGMKIVDCRRWKDSIGVLCVREKRYSGTNSKDIKFDDSGEKALCKYLAKVETIVDDIKNKLTKYKGKKIYIWGAGTHTAMLYQLGLFNELEIAGIIDSNANYMGKEILGSSVIPPDKKYIEEWPILISSYHAQESIDKSIHELGLDNETIKLYGI